MPLDCPPILEAAIALAGELDAIQVTDGETRETLFVDYVDRLATVDQAGSDDVEPLARLLRQLRIAPQQASRDAEIVQFSCDLARLRKRLEGLRQQAEEAQLLLCELHESIEQIVSQDLEVAAIVVEHRNERPDLFAAGDPPELKTGQS